MPLDNRTCFSVNLRDGLRCRACGRGPARQAGYHRGFEYHHVVPVSAGGPDVVQNVVLLCDACHGRHHRGATVLSFGPQETPTAVACRACGAAVDPATVPMNCGWYGCTACGTRVHLFDHFGLAEAGDDAG